MSEGPSIDNNKIPGEDALLKLAKTSNQTTGRAEAESKTNCFQELESLRLKYPRNVVLSYININSVRNKLDNLSLMIRDNIDILVIAETKIDSSFPASQFHNVVPRKIQTRPNH